MCKKINQTEGGQGLKIKKNGGPSNYGMRNVIWTFEGYTNNRCENERKEGHCYIDCDDCNQIQYWSCSGCPDGENVYEFYRPYPSYRVNLKCDGCGAGHYKSPEELSLYGIRKKDYHNWGWFSK